jgi:FAD synthase
MEQAKPSVKAQMGATGFTPQEAAFKLTEQGHTITAKQIRRALRKGTLPAKQISGRWYINRKDLTKFAKAKEVKASKES